jgi:glycosyltransferase involved in cell wall biosynthesis
VAEQEGVSKKKISVIYNGIPPEDVMDSSPLTAEEFPALFQSKPIIGIVANLKPIKRIDVAIRAVALAALRCPGLRLVILGKDGPSQEAPSMRKVLQELAQGLGIGDRVVFCGSVTTPMRYIKRFDVAVLSSESEGFSNALIEYMQASRPIICTETGGNCELIQDGVNGCVVPVGDVAALAERIITLVSNQTLAAQLGEAAKDAVKSYSIARMVSEQMQCYDEVLARSFANASARTN